MMWPAFWGRLKGEHVDPLKPEDVKTAGKGILDGEAQVVATLKALVPDSAEEGVPALVAGGTVYGIGIDDRLEVVDADTGGLPPDVSAWTLVTSNVAAALVAPFSADKFDPYENAEHWDISELIGAVLVRLDKVAPDGTVPVFVNEGRIFARDADGSATVIDGRADASAAWGWMQDGKVSPLVPPFAIRVVVATTGRDEVLTEEQVAMVLAKLSADGEGEPVYIASGRLFKRGTDGSLGAFEHAAAEPLSWPLAHDVRPAAQSLGVKACTDCHAKDAPFLFAPVMPYGPLVTQAAVARPMHEFMQLEGSFQRLFGLTFEFRPLFKVIMLVVSCLIALVLLFAALKALERVLAFTAGGRRV